MSDFEEIYSLYFKDVYLYILRLAKDEHIAEEITSDAFYRAMNSIDSFRGDCDARVWLCRIAKNCFFSYQRKRRRSVSLSDEAMTAIPDSSPSVFELFSDCEDARSIESILHRLPEPYREVFMWRVYAELSFKQIADIFGKTDNWACVTYHRARKMIMEEMEEKNE